MRELLMGAWQGWQCYTDDGKYAALLLLVLLFLWFRREEEKEKLLLTYTTLMTILCIFPVSAAFFMLYQTRFYDYEWIWSYVPVTLMIAYGATLFLQKTWQKYGQKVLKCIGITVSMAALVFLCGSMGRADDNGMSKRETREEIYSVLEQLTERTGDKAVCLWAPREIMENARGYNGEIHLVYGRNMWEPALGAYSYETYGETEESLYQWMTWMQESSMKGFMPDEPTEEDVVAGGVQKLAAAVELGVNTVLLPGNILPEHIEQLEKMTGLEIEALDDYYLLNL